MTVFYEKCPCGAEFRVEDDGYSLATTALATWRTGHRHEISKGFGDMGSDRVNVGFETERHGWIG